MKHKILNSKGKKFKNAKKLKGNLWSFIAGSVSERIRPTLKCKKCSF
jgi:hypothetical protein